VGAYAGPDGVESGLVLALDAGNPKGFDDDENLLTNTTSAAAWASGTFTTETTYPILGLNTVRITDLSSDGDAANLNGGAISPGTYTVSHYIDTINSTSTSVLLYIFTFHALNDGFTFSNANATFTLSTKTFSSISYTGPAWSNASVSAVNIGNGIYRISITATTSLAGTGIRAYLTPLPLDTSYLIVAGSQYETGSVANTYYPTSGTAKNRGTVWTDLSGNGNNGTLVNGVGYSGDNFGSLVFDGVDDYVNVLNPGISQTFSVLSWINCTNVSSSNNIVSKNGPYFMRIVSSKLRFNVLTDTDWLFQVGNATLSNNVWYNLAMVYDGSTWKGYINSNLDFSVSKTGTISSNAALYIGYTLDIGEQAGFNGNIAQVSIYNRALTAGEITQNFNATKSRYGL